MSLDVQSAFCYNPSGTDEILTGYLVTASLALTLQ